MLVLIKNVNVDVNADCCVRKWYSRFAIWAQETGHLYCVHGCRVFCSNAAHALLQIRYLLIFKVHFMHHISTKIYNNCLTKMMSKEN